MHYSIRTARPWRRLAALALLAVLAACGSGEQDGRVLGCPNVALVQDVDRLTRFRPGQGRDLTDVLFEARLSGFDAPCVYRRGGAAVDLTINFAVTLGPASRDRVAAYPYFVAIANPEGEIIAKEVFEARVEVPAGNRRVTAGEKVEPLIPNLGDRSAAAWTIYIGLQLTPEELAYNRSARGG